MKVYSRFKNNIWTTDSAKIWLLSSKNGEVKFLMSVIDVFTKYAWVKSLKTKKARNSTYWFYWNGNWI